MTNRHVSWEIDDSSRLAVPDGIKLGDEFEGTVRIVVSKIEDELAKLHHDAGLRAGIYGRGSATLTIEFSQIRPKR